MSIVTESLQEYAKRTRGTARAANHQAIYAEWHQRGNMILASWHVKDMARGVKCPIGHKSLGLLPSDLRALPTSRD